MSIDSLGLPASISADDDLPQFLAGKQWIIDTEEFRRTPDFYGNIAIPAWLLDREALHFLQHADRVRTLRHADALQLTGHL